MLDLFLDALTDSTKLIPFLFLTYLAMETLEHRAGDRTQQLIRRAGAFGPVWGGILGVIPQCGFSAAAASLYAGRVITLGTLTAVFLSTSDEMLPIFLSEQVPTVLILKILMLKVLISAISGLLIEWVYRRLLCHPAEEMDIHTICEEEHCSCEGGIFRSALRHTIQIFLFVLLFSFALNLGIAWIGEDALSGLFQNIPVIGELIAALVGMIPNCASSVVITQLYLQGIIGSDPLMSGLLANAGVGLLVLCRLNRNWKQNARIAILVYALGVVWGSMIGFTGIL